MMRSSRRLCFEQVKELVVFLRKIEAHSIAGKAGNDAAVFLVETGRFEGLAEQFPT